MTTSKFIKIDTNILLEYIYDDGNIISEPYSIVSNTNTKVNSFLSTTPSTKNYIFTQPVLINNISIDQIFTYQLVKINSSQGQYGRLDFNNYSFIQKSDYGSSVPIRYDTLRVWVPINYTFGNMKGFNIRVYTLDFNNQNWVDLSNYFYNMSDIDQYNNDMQFASNVLMQQETPWGKYVDIQFPSPTQVASQRTNNITTPNTINFNLTGGIGLSKDAPVFVDFFFIDTVQTVNDLSYYYLSNQKSISVPQKPEFDVFGVVVEPSSQGDFFVIYPILNGSIGEFNQFIQDSVILGNRYYLKFKIDVFEKNIQTSTQTIVVTDDFIDELEFRPILKYSTTTAIIDVECSLVDAVDSSEIVRYATYAMLANEVSNYSTFLSKIDLSKANPINVYKLKGTYQSNLNLNNPATIQTVVTTQNVAFVVYSRYYHIVLDTSNATYLSQTWLGTRQLSINVFPYDNIIVFNVISPNSIKQYVPSDLTIYDNLQLVFRSDKINLSFNVYQDSDQNNFASGTVVFRVNSDKYSDIKKIYSANFNTFYINGTTSDGTNTIIYAGFFTPWDITGNITKLNNSFNQNLSQVVNIHKTNQTFIESLKIKEVKGLLANKLNLPKTINTSSIPTTQIQGLNLNPNQTVESILNSVDSQIVLDWKPYWKSSDPIISYNVMMMSYNYQFGSNSANSSNRYVYPSDLRALAISFKNAGIISSVSIDKTTGLLAASSLSQVNLILSYFKIYNFNPLDSHIVSYISSNMVDINQYLTSNVVKSENTVTVGSNTPPSKLVFDLINKYVTAFQEFHVNPKYNNYKH